MVRWLSWDRGWVWCLEEAELKWEVERWEVLGVLLWDLEVGCRKRIISASSLGGRAGTYGGVVTGGGEGDTGGVGEVGGAGGVGELGGVVAEG